METLSIQNKAIDFLNTYNRNVLVEVSEHMDIDSLFTYNRSRYDSDYFETIQYLDWDEFYFEVKFKIEFDYESHHAKETRDNDEESIIEFKNVEAITEILVCLIWIDDEYQDYDLSEKEMKMIKRYFEKHITLSE
ncbi:hypothetical protein [Chryseobacterium potabilaquae]|uniref:Uncharacterized protein n=1 Tax=Chryseobacterium potabilaquae TaxID=2675057 RepID=A0A6N4XBM7_9FLAO|nr:hypothetical protein [Chryseobacterium potabilaquae]CAA7196846.1 hypothetical protein CHRY9293_02912 [Chryseobacterium potabilaquae]